MILEPPLSGGPGGRLGIEDRAALGGILFVFHAGCGFVVDHWPQLTLTCRVRSLTGQSPTGGRNGVVIGVSVLVDPSGGFSGAVKLFVVLDHDLTVVFFSFVAGCVSHGGVSVVG